MGVARSRGKCIAALATAFLFLFAGSIRPVSAEEPHTAEELTGSLTLNWNGAAALSGKLVDGSIYTKLNCEKGDILTLKSERPIATLYLIFDRPPGGYSVVTAQGYQACGGYGFLHELVRLRAPAGEVEIRLPEGRLCEIRAFAQGELPGEIQDWDPPYADCDMLLIPTHADDEHLFFGGILPTYGGQQGRKLQVAYLTNHWGEPYRPHELLDGLWEAGITAYPVISEFNDYYSESLEHAKTLYDTEAVIAYETMLLRRFRPEVVIGHDIDGEYGHGVHRLNAWALMQAVEHSGEADFCPESAGEYGTFDVPKTYLHLYPENPLIMDVDTPLPKLGGRTAFEVAQDAYLKHKSQQQWWFSVEKSGKYDLRKFGLYRSTVGPDTMGLDSGSGDFFEHITFWSDASVSSEENPSEPEETSDEGAAWAGVSSTPSAQADETNGEMGGISVILLAVVAGLAVVVLILAWILWRKTKHER